MVLGTGAKPVQGGVYAKEYRVYAEEYGVYADKDGVYAEPFPLNMPTLVSPFLIEVSGFCTLKHLD